MKVKVAVKEIAQVRAKPTNASMLLSTLRSDDAHDSYLATKLQHGWYYIDEMYGWVNSIDLQVIQIIEDFDDDDSSIDSTPDHNTNTSFYDGEEIISAINKAYSTINASKITFLVTDTNGTREINLQTMLRSMQLALDDMQDVIVKVNTMPDIPRLPLMMDGVKYVLQSEIVNGEPILTWEQMDYDDISHTPTDPVIASEF